MLTYSELPETQKKKKVTESHGKDEYTEILSFGNGNNLFQFLQLNIS